MYESAEHQTCPRFQIPPGMATLREKRGICPLDRSMRVCPCCLDQNLTRRPSRPVPCPSEAKRLVAFCRRVTANDASWKRSNRRASASRNTKQTNARHVCVLRKHWGVDAVFPCPFLYTLCNEPVARKGYRRRFDGLCSAQTRTDATKTGRVSSRKRPRPRRTKRPLASR